MQSMNNTSVCVVGSAASALHLSCKIYTLKSHVSGQVLCISQTCPLLHTVWKMQQASVCLCEQEQASKPQPMEVETVERPSAGNAYGHGSGILGALSGNALASKPAGSNLQRLGSKMVIPPAIDSSGLIDVASISRQPNKQTAAPSGLYFNSLKSPTHTAHGIMSIQS